MTKGSKYQNIINQRTDGFIVETNKILRNTYLMLSLTLIFSSITAAFSMLISAPQMNPIMTLVIYFGLLFAIQSTLNSSLSILLTFVLTGFLGFTLGPILNFYLVNFSNGSQLIMLSLACTGSIFLGLSFLAINPEKDFSKLQDFLSVGTVVALVAIFVNLFLKIPAIHLATSLAVSFISGGMIIWQTNQIINGGEKNYITATVTLYVSILNIFLTILQFLAMFIGKRD